MPVTGADQVRKNMGRVFKDISDKKAPQFISAVMSIGLNHSKEMQYIEFSTLINSARSDIKKSRSGIVGVVSYNTNYAVFLENNEKLNPRPPSMKKGPAFNPNAKPHALRRGFQDQESVALIKKAEQIFKI
tara:strand:- start:449 stop:841 length:393 start_codon:yes stop_codon:yes gene_type:complete